jgi:hypothetical protein
MMQFITRLFGFSTVSLRKVVLLSAYGLLSFAAVNAAEAEDFLLGTRFGMSQVEVASALKKQNGRLLNYDEYQKSAVQPLITGDYHHALSANQDGTYSMYMPSVEMLGTSVEAMFLFEGKRLSNLSLYFQTHQDANALISKIKAALRKQYQFTGRETQDADFTMAFPQAYTLGFKSKSVKASFVVNPPTLCLHLYPSPVQR